MVGARRNSPLVVGVGEGESFLASDVAAFIAHTRSAIELGQDQVVELRREGVTVTDFDGRPVDVREYHVDWDVSAAEKGGHDSFMLKEIEDQPKAVADTLLGRIDGAGTLHLDEVRIPPHELREVDKVVIVACGTAFHAGMIAKYAIEHWTRIACETELASEFRYRDPILDHRTLVVAISQSGETMDTLMALRHAREQGAKVLAICNTNGSTIPRESDAVLYTHAGPEVAVASTKAFLTQLVACYLVALYLGQIRGTKWGDEIRTVIRQLSEISGAVERVLKTMEPVRALARSLADHDTVLFVGRHVGYPVALEGALKLKELAYMHAEGFAAGELKHGPIALIEDGLPVVVVVPSPRGRSVLHDKIVSNIQEIRARGAHDRHRRGGRRGGGPVRRPSDQDPRYAYAASAAGVDRAVAGVRLRTGDGPRQRRGPAAQSGEVRDRGVARVEGTRVIIGVGIDVAEIERFDAALKRTPHLADRLFLEKELLLPSGERRGVASLAVRFAAKEALAKALGAPGGLLWTDAEVYVEDSGQPRLRVRGTVAARAAELGVRNWHVSLSHDAGVASAVVIAEG